MESSSSSQIMVALQEQSLAASKRDEALKQQVAAREAGYAEAEEQSKKKEIIVMQELESSRRPRLEKNLDEQIIMKQKEKEFPEEVEQRRRSMAGKLEQQAANQKRLVAAEAAEEEGVIMEDSSPTTGALLSRCCSVVVMGRPPLPITATGSVKDDEGPFLAGKCSFTDFLYAKLFNAEDELNAERTERKRLELSMQKIKTEIEANNNNAAPFLTSSKKERREHDVAVVKQREEMWTRLEDAQFAYRYYEASSDNAKAMSSSADPQKIIVAVPPKMKRKRYEHKHKGTTGGGVLSHISSGCKNKRKRYEHKHYKGTTTGGGVLSHNNKSSGCKNRTSHENGIDIDSFRKVLCSLIAEADPSKSSHLLDQYDRLVMAIKREAVLEYKQQNEPVVERPKKQAVTSKGPDGVRADLAAKKEFRVGLATEQKLEIFVRARNEFQHQYQGKQLQLTDGSKRFLTRHVEPVLNCLDVCCHGDRTRFLQIYGPKIFTTHWKCKCACTPAGTSTVPAMNNDLAPLKNQSV